MQDSRRYSVADSLTALPSRIACRREPPRDRRSSILMSASRASAGAQLHSVAPMRARSFRLPRARSTQPLVTGPSPRTRSAASVPAPSMMMGTLDTSRMLPHASHPSIVDIRMHNSTSSGRLSCLETQVRSNDSPETSRWQHPGMCWPKVLNRCIVRAMPTIDSDGCRPPVPGHADHLFRCMASSFSRALESVVALVWNQWTACSGILTCITDSVGSGAG
jgi:hypothetical protein